MAHTTILERLQTRLRNVLRQGLTPRALALTVAVGVAVGLFPLPGTTTALCVLIAQRFQLNHVAIQTANWAMYPLYPFTTVALLRVGLWATASSPTATALDLPGLLHGGFGRLTETLGLGLLGAVLAWALAAVPVTACVFGACQALLRRRGVAHDGEHR